ncbi:DUF3265 domain-containing protein [Vibrio vulnificus]|nr:DUF3265 domain-containing protein [Vibrio vulnificus]
MQMTIAISCLLIHNKLLKRDSQCMAFLACGGFCDLGDVR